MLADRLRCHEAHRLIGDLIFGKIARAVRQGFQHAGQQFIEPLFLQRRDGDDLLEIVQRLKLRDQRQQFALVGQQIDLVEQKKNRSARFFRQVEDEGVCAVPLLLRVDNHQNQLTPFERLAHLGHHLASQRRARLVNSRRVDQHDLPSLTSFLLGDVDDAQNAVARGLRLRRNDGQLLAHQRVEQRALARIGPAENANESGMEGHRDRLQVSGGRCQVAGRPRFGLSQSGGTPITVTLNRTWLFLKG